MDKSNLISFSASEARKLIRNGLFQDETSGIALGFIQANVLILPESLAGDFLGFCLKNPKPLGLIGYLEKGEFSTKGSDLDIRTDVGKYLVYKEGKVIQEKKQIMDLWRTDLVSFFLGCSFTFDNILSKNGISLRHIEQKTKIPMYRTNIECVPFGQLKNIFLTVSMRPIKNELVSKAIRITSRFPKMHGDPVYVGDPSEIGIKNLSMPDYGDSIAIEKGETPVFWACGGTVFDIATNYSYDMCITHSPSRMLILDDKEEDYIYW